MDVLVSPTPDLRARLAEARTRLMVVAPIVEDAVLAAREATTDFAARWSGEKNLPVWHEQRTAVLGPTGFYDLIDELERLKLALGMADLPLEHR